MSLLKEFLKFVGLDLESIRNSRILKWGGFFVVFMGSIAVMSYFLMPVERRNETVSIHVDKPEKINTKKYDFHEASSLFGWASIVCLSLAGFMEPTPPKIDRRFKNGFKNNAVIRKKSKEEKQIQWFLIMLGSVFGFLWYLSAS